MGSELILEAWPSEVAKTTQRTLIERSSSSSTNITLRTHAHGRVQVCVDTSANRGNLNRTWIVRFHLLPTWRFSDPTIDGKRASVQTLHPATPGFPLQGAGSAPAQLAGMVVEMVLQPSWSQLCGD